MGGFRSLEVRDCQGTLWAFFRRYEGEAFASFEGSLAALNLLELNGATTRETKELRRQTLFPQLDFVVVPVASDTVKELKLRLSSRGILGNKGSVIHTLLAVGDQLLLSACDNFHDECTVVSTAVPEAFLMQLQSLGLIRSYGEA